MSGLNEPLLTPPEVVFKDRQPFKVGCYKDQFIV